MAVKLIDKERTNINESDIVNTYIEAKEMRVYLTDNLLNLRDKQFACIICGDRKTITQKCKDLKWFAGNTDDDYANEAFKNHMICCLDLD